MGSCPARGLAIAGAPGACRTDLPGSPTEEPPGRHQSSGKGVGVTCWVQGKLQSPREEGLGGQCGVYQSALGSQWGQREKEVAYEDGKSNFTKTLFGDTPLVEYEGQ